MSIRALVRCIAALALLALVAAPPAAQAEPTYPLAVVDDAGVRTTFHGPPERIVSLSPGHTETVFALGAGERLVAVDNYSDFPPEAVAIPTRLTTFPTVSVETIVALGPDLVVSEVEKDEVLDQLRRQGVPVL
jgi:iron complex transport system substrate-binding protein